MRRTGSRWPVLVQVLIASIVALALASVPAQAQRGVSLVIGGPGMGGLSLPVGERTAVRADLALQYSSSDIAFTSGKRTILEVGISTLHHLCEFDEMLSMYLAPRVATREIIDDDEIGSSEYYEMSASIGFDARVTSRLSLFAELGPQLAYQESSFEFSGSTERSVVRTWTIENAIGVTFRF